MLFIWDGEYVYLHLLFQTRASTDNHKRCMAILKTRSPDEKPCWQDAALLKTERICEYSVVENTCIHQSHWFYNNSFNGFLYFETFHRWFFCRIKWLACTEHVSPFLCTQFVIDIQNCSAMAWHLLHFSFHKYIQWPSIQSNIINHPFMMSYIFVSSRSCCSNLKL